MNEPNTLAHLYGIRQLLFEIIQKNESGVESQSLRFAFNQRMKLLGRQFKPHHFDIVNSSELESTARALVAKGMGILPADAERAGCAEYRL